MVYNYNKNNTLFQNVIPIFLSPKIWKNVIIILEVRKLISVSNQTSLNMFISF